jgi:hypothetical protein
MMRSSWLLASLGLLAGCCQNDCEMTRYHEDGRAKPVALITPMIDTSSFDAAWSISEELTQSIAGQVGATGTIFVHANDDVSFTENPFSQNIGWVKREFPDQEFVVFLELVEHEAVLADPAKKDLPPQEQSTYLNMAVRMRIVDVRSATPKIVLQEMIKDNYFIPKALLPTNYNVATWGTDEYLDTGMKAAHDKMVGEISHRISDYILLAKSR